MAAEVDRDQDLLALLQWPLAVVLPQLVLPAVLQAPQVPGAMEAMLPPPVVRELAALRQAHKQLVLPLPALVCPALLAQLAMAQSVRPSALQTRTPRVTLGWLTVLRLFSPHS